MQGSDWLLGRGVCASVGGGRSQRSSTPLFLPPSSLRPSPLFSASAPPPHSPLYKLQNQDLGLDQHLHQDWNQDQDQPTGSNAVTSL